MRKENISDALNLLNDTFIDETDSLRSCCEMPQKNAILHKIYSVAGKYWKWIAAAACLSLVVLTGNWLLSQKTSDTRQTEKLPMLSITENTSDGMGFEGYMAYDISELINNNPWSETSQLSVLPVYQLKTLSFLQNRHLKH